MKDIFPRKVLEWFSSNYLIEFSSEKSTRNAWEKYFTRFSALSQDFLKYLKSAKFEKYLRYIWEIEWDKMCFNLRNEWEFVSSRIFSIEILARNSY